MTDSNANNDISQSKPSPVAPLTIVAIGASAGGLAAFRDFFENLADDTGMAFVIIQHLAPSKKSELTAILQRFSVLPVETITESVTLLPDHVYVIPPDQSLTIADDTLHLGEPSQERHELSSIDHFFESLAETKREHAIGVVLSGSRSDGTRGIIAIKKRKGLTIAQSPDDAEYTSMPKSAIDTGQVDLILPAAEIAERLSGYTVLTDGGALEKMAPKKGNGDQHYRGILNRLHTKTGHDFSHYKRSTILRRIDRRLRLHDLPDLMAYREFLDEHPEESEDLFDELLITVTEFFRDSEAFEALAEKVIPRLYERQKAGTPIRIWVPACATGEEVYSIAMLMWEESQRQGIYPDFKIFATDLDARAIAIARRGLYSHASCQKLSHERISRFFTSESGAWQIASELRERVLFAIHDILRDPPFARQDLISCRNLLIYLDRQAQIQVFESLSYALRSEGRLFLGSSEFLGDASELFSPVDESHRIYRPLSIDRHLVPTSTMLANRDRSRSVIPPELPARPDRRLEYQHHALLADEFAPPSILTNRQFDILHIVGEVQDFLRIPSGKPDWNLFDTVIPSLRIPLRSALFDAFENHERISSTDIRVESDDETMLVKIEVIPVTAVESESPDEQFAQVIFQLQQSTPSVDTPSEASEPTSGDKSLKHTITQLETQNHRLQQQLHATIERYETTTEELKTSNEELLTINEELQSTTEELETSKEELQSTNEELTTVNDELSFKISELDNVNSDLENLLSATDIGTIFLDCLLEVRRFTDPVRDYFNLRDTDLGRPLADITHHLQYEEIVSDAQTVLKTLHPIEKEICYDDNTWFITRLHPYRTVDDRIDGVVITFFDITERKRSQQRLAERELLFRTIFERASDGLFLFRLTSAGDPKPFSQVNKSACQRLGYSATELSQMTLTDILDPTSLDVEGFLNEVRQQGDASAEIQFRTRHGDSIVEEIRTRYFTLDGEPTLIMVSRDISRRKSYEEGLVEAKEQSERLAELRASFLANMSHEIRTPLTSIIGVSQLLSREDLPDKHRKMIRLIRTSGQRLKETLDSVLDISRIEAGEMKPQFRQFDVVDQVRDNIELFRSNAERRDLGLAFDCPHEAFEFCIDPGFLNRIVYNLVDNAIKFTDTGDVEVKLDVDDEALELIVADTGMGIAEEFLPNLFDKFKQASSGVSRSHEGSGLGMALVSHLIELMDGQLDVDSAVGQGTTFRVHIPAGSCSEDDESSAADEPS